MKTSEKEQINKYICVANEATRQKKRQGSQKHLKKINKHTHKMADPTGVQLANRI